MKWILLLLTNLSFAFAAPSPATPSKEEFLKMAWAHLQTIRALPVSTHTQNASVVGQRLFVPLRDLIRGQDEFSIDNIFAKLSERVAVGDVIWNPKTAEWQMSHDHGQSAVPIDDPIEAVKGRQGLVIIDGHHDLYLSLFLGAKTIAIEVKEDLTNLTPIEFWKNLQERELVYTGETAEELALSAPRTEDIRDNPNRYLASLLALKVAAQFENGAVNVNAVKGPDAAVWIKVNNSTPFIEFYVAKALTQAGITYDSNWGKVVPADVIERCRQVMLSAKENDSRFKTIPILETKEAALKIRHDKVSAAEFIRPTFSAHALSFATCGGVFQ